MSISLAFEQNQIKFFRKCVHLEVEADNEARKGTFHFAHGQCQHDRQEGQCQGGGLEIKLGILSRRIRILLLTQDP